VPRDPFRRERKRPGAVPGNGAGAGSSGATGEGRSGCYEESPIDQEAQRPDEQLERSGAAASSADM